MERVGVRELRQNLSVYLRKVKRGQALEVTERGKTVARLVPPSTGDEYWDRQIALGKVRPPSKPGPLPKPVKLPPGAKPLSEILQEMRDSERF
ncbi:MAG: type II toxin-antitoxin system prevent-host-death family antitoxin [Gaiellaceae bacterium]